MQTFQITTQASVARSEVRGKVTDGKGTPLREVYILARRPNLEISTTTGADGSFRLRDVQPGDYVLTAGRDQGSAVSASLKPHDVAVVEWVEVAGQSSLALPLAEIRTVNIVWEGGLAFRPDTLWPQARYRWWASGGALVEDSGGATSWRPPEKPGAYLLQVAADWGQMGLAVDAVTLVVREDGSVAIG